MSHSTKDFLLLNNINHSETPPQSPVSPYLVIVFVKVILQNFVLFKDLMCIEMIWGDLKYHLIHNCHCKTKHALIRETKKWWAKRMNDIVYCNSKFDHLYRVVDQVIAMTGRATGL